MILALAYSGIFVKSPITYFDAMYSRNVKYLYPIRKEIFLSVVFSKIYVIIFNLAFLMVFCLTLLNKYLTHSMYFCITL